MCHKCVAAHRCSNTLLTVLLIIAGNGIQLDSTEQAQTRKNLSRLLRANFSLVWSTSESNTSLPLSTIYFKAGTPSQYLEVYTQVSPQFPITFLIFQFESKLVFLHLCIIKSKKRMFNRSSLRTMLGYSVTKIESNLVSAKTTFVSMERQHSLHEALPVDHAVPVKSSLFLCRKAILQVLPFTWQRTVFSLKSMLQHLYTCLPGTYILPNDKEFHWIKTLNKTLSCLTLSSKTLLQGPTLLEPLHVKEFYSHSCTK